MGQSLYAPPSVAGWDGGSAWINSTALLARTNLALGLLSDQNEALGQRSNPWALAARQGAGRRAALAGFFANLLADGAIDPRARQQVEKAALNPAFTDLAAAREVVRLIVTSPEYQLG